MKKKYFKFKLEPKLSGTDLIFFLKRLSFLLNAHISLLLAIHTISSQAKPRTKQIFASIEHSISQGQRLSFGLEKFPASFPPFVVHSIRAGEESGTLGKHINLLALELERRNALVQKLAGSLLYPFIVAGGTVALSLFLIISIFPKVVSLFKGLRVELPASTRFILFISSLLREYGIFFLAFLVLCSGLAFYAFKKYPKLHDAKDAYLLKIPVVGKIIRNYALSSFCKTLSLMLASSIPISQALSHTAQSIGNRLYASSIKKVEQNVRNGRTLSHALKEFPNLFPEVSIQLVEIGETTGALSGTLNYLSALFDQENEETSKRILTLVEPALMAVMGIVVGFIALSIITPIYGITQNLNR